MLLGLLEVDAQAIRANKKGQLAYISRRRGLVCLGLLDVNAQALKARQDGATCIHFKTLKQFLCPGLLDVNAQAITSNKMGQLAYTFQGAASTRAKSPWAAPFR